MTPLQRFSIILPLALLFPREVWGYCQAKVCDSGECPRDEQGCQAGGTPIAWYKGCVSFAVQEGASEQRGLSADELEAEIEFAAGTWQGAACDEGTPELALVSDGQVECDQVEFNYPGQNANIWMFRDFDWPYDTEGHAAYTTLIYDADTGALLDADVEINTAELNITAGPGEGGFDLRSVVLHEMGHALGLDHSEEVGAVMTAQLEPNAPRHRLSDDDRAGICALYASAPRDISCSPVGGFAGRCGDDQVAQPEEPSEEGKQSATVPASSSGCALHTPRRAAFPSGWVLFWVLLLARRSTRSSGGPIDARVVR